MILTKYRNKFVKCCLHPSKYIPGYVNYPCYCCPFRPLLDIPPIYIPPYHDPMIDQRPKDHTIYLKY